MKFNHSTLLHFVIIIYLFIYYDYTLITIHFLFCLKEKDAMASRLNSQDRETTF